MDSILVFSHLRWDFVYQRPQHLLSRLARHYRILFFEEPQLHEGEPFASFSSPLPNLTVCKPHTPLAEPGFHGDQMPMLRDMLGELGDEYNNPTVWFYTPMALPLLDELQAKYVVYDCMDELSSFRNAPKRLVEYENALLSRADIVFTGGPSLYVAKQHRHHNVHCFPSSVDAAHFRQSLDRNIAHPSQRMLPSPRLGYYGVIDERVDADLIACLADAHPEWQIVLVGPIVKVDPKSLPSRPNIHYMGQQAYSALPQFLASWDLCLMPFAINESTRFISPTKSLEYMAAGLPIVSTPVKDVVDLHGDIIEIASDANGFIAACERMLALPEAQMQEKIRMMRDRLATASWDRTVESMRSLLNALGNANADSLRGRGRSAPEPDASHASSIHKSRRGAAARP